MEKRGPVLHIVVVGFHHKKGCQVRGRGCPSTPASPLRSCASSRPSPGPLPRAERRLPGCGSCCGRGASGGAGGLRSSQGAVKEGLGAGEAPLGRGLSRPGDAWLGRDSARPGQFVVMELPPFPPRLGAPAGSEAERGLAG